MNNVTIPVPEGADEVLDTLARGRWSCRAFLDREVPRATIERMLTIAQRAPSWCNTQPWNIHIVSGAATERLRQAIHRHVDTHGGQAQPDFEMPEEYTGVHLERRRVSGWQLYRAVGVKRGDREASARQSVKNLDFFGAPHVAIVTSATDQGTYGAVDTGLYVGNLLLAARSLGLAAVPQAAIARFAPVVHDVCDIPETQKVLMAVSFGYADEAHPANSYRTERAELHEVAQFHG